MTTINGVMAIKYYLMDQRKEVIVGEGDEKRRKRRRTSKGGPEDEYQCCSRSSEICLFDTGMTQHKNISVVRV